MQFTADRRPTCDATERWIVTYETPNKLANFFNRRRVVKEELVAKESGEKYVCEYYPDGTRQHTYNLTKDGLSTGTSFRYRPDGTRQEELHHEQGEWHGKHVIYSLNGKVRLKSEEYAQGKRVGEWVERNEAEEIIAKRFYKDDGSEVGFEVSYDQKHNPVDFKALRGADTVEIKGDLATFVINGETLAYDRGSEPGWWMAATCAYDVAVDYMNDVRLKKVDAMNLVQESVSEITAFERSFDAIAALVPVLIL